MPNSPVAAPDLTRVAVGGNGSSVEAVVGAAETDETVTTSNVPSLSTVDGGLLVRAGVHDDRCTLVDLAVEDLQAELVVTVG